MQFPFIVQSDLTQKQLNRYERHINSDESGWHRRWTESIWRRHQALQNARLSGWQEPEDARRRLIHFYDEYGVANGNFVLRNAYLSINLTLPKAELDGYQTHIHNRIREGQWELATDRRNEQLWQRGNLRANIMRYPLHPEDTSRGKSFPSGYQHLELRVYSDGYEIPDDLEGRPWRWFYEVGMRDVLASGRPRYVEPEELAKHLPAQVELGCGPSTEAGISHLSSLHRIYGVSRADHSFVFQPSEDNLLEVLSDPEAKYREMTAIYRGCIVAEPTPFYLALADLWSRRHLVGPIITNNFDCLCADLGLPETSMRRYDSEPYFPMYRDGGPRDVPIHPDAKSLLVVGVHADRRGAQRYARERGLKILYIDPERYLAPDGSEISYPVESPQNSDLFVRMPAGQAMPRLYQAVLGRQFTSRPVMTATG
jgi:hypothetical protein